GYTIKVYVNGVEKSTQVVDNAVLSYNNMNTIDLSTPVEFESLDDVLVAIDIDASGFSVSSNDVIGMCYGMATPGYSDLLRQASEPEYYSLNQSSVNSGYGEFLVSWAISAVLSKLDENGKPNINCDIIESYEILRDDNKLAEVTTTDYFDTDITTGRHEYKILVHYADGSISEPARANINFTPKYEVLRAVNDVRVSIDDSADAMKAEWDAPLDNDATVLSYARGNSSGKGITKTGATELIEYTVAHEYPYTYFDWYEGYNITALRFYPTAEAVFAIVLEVDGIDQEMIVMEEMDTEDGYVLNRWNEVKLSNPHKIRAGENVRVKLVCAEVDPATYPITMDSGRGNVGVSDLYSFNYSTFSSAYSDGGLSGSWMLGLVVANDDTELLPVVGYNVELDGEQANSDLITETVFAKDGLGWKNAETHRIRVNTIFNVDNNERVVEGEQVVFNVVAGVERLDIDRVNVYPNPATSYINVDGAVDTLTLYDMQGALVMEANANMLDVTTLPAGNYLLKIGSNEGVRTVKILIVR
ncbi:MAG: T9SS type A sorting domain-containing protein, partial [Bacteroidaceae bacterium]|nr:T9SS type A sorting domain-containing protein [Bacteroidaceae bacterium]